MQVVSGVIDSINTQTVKTKFGDKAVYHAMINGQDVNLGFKCAYSEGESVTLNVEHKYGSLQHIQDVGKANGTGATGPSPVQAVPTQPATKAAASSEFPVAKGSRGITIARQNSGGHAAQIVAALIAQGAINNAEEATEAFMEIAYDIADFATGHREIKMALEQDADDFSDE